MTRKSFACAAAACAAAFFSLPTAPDALASGDHGSIAAFLAGDLPPVGKDPRDPAIAPQEPGDGAEFSPWSDWTAGQSFTPLSRININMGGGAASIDLGAQGNYWTSGPGFFMQGGYAFAPFLAVSLSFNAFFFQTDEQQVYYAGNYYYVNTSKLDVYTIGFEARVRLPFNLIGPQLFRFSKAREGLGLVPSFKLGFGLAKVKGASAEYSLGGVTQENKIWDGYSGYYYDIGAELEIRWRYFGLSLSYSMFSVQAPDIVWGSDFLGLQDRSVMTQALFTLGIGIYF